VTSSIVQTARLQCVVKFKSPPYRLFADEVSYINQVIVDVSCDASNPHNPIPIYNRNTTFTDPIINVANGEKVLDLISIDHLPSLVPLESSREFAGLMISHILEFHHSDVWNRALALFEEKTKPFRG